MQHVATLQIAQRAVRERICPKCYERPAGSEVWGPELPRSCEGHCTLFMHLPQLAEAEEERDAALRSIEQTVHGLICQTCHVKPTSGDFCSEHLARTCPLSRYGGEMIGILERLQKRH